jgi:recombination protein RecT
MTSTTIDKIKSGEKPANPVAQFGGFLERFKPQLSMALPKHLNADRMARLALTAFSQNPALQQCEPRTIVASLMVAGQMGLEIGVSGQGYLVPYKRTCTFVPGWQGIVDIVNRSGRASVWTGAVFEGDKFDYELGDSPRLKHQPSGEDDPDLLTHVYAIGRVNGSDWPVIEVWPIKRVAKHFKRFNKVGDRHYAHQHWEMYARKIPLLQVCKYMPKSIELNNAIALSHAADNGMGATIEGDFVTLHNVDPETGEIGGPAAPPPAEEPSSPPADQPPAPPAEAPPAPSEGPGRIAPPEAQGQPPLSALEAFVARIDNALDPESARAVLQEGEQAFANDKVSLKALRQAMKAAWE